MTTSHDQAAGQAISSGHPLLTINLSSSESSIRRRGNKAQGDSIVERMMRLKPVADYVKQR